MANVGILLNDGTFHIPSFDKTVAGTTAISCMKHIENELIPKGLIESLSREDVTMETAISEAKEVMLFGGKKVVPILKLDGHQISEEPGQVALSFQEYLKSKEKGTSDKVDLTPFNTEQSR